MIGKVIPKKKNKPSSIERLNNYVRDVNGEGKDGHKVLYEGCLNLASLATATMEIKATAAENTRSKNPIMHCLLTWRTGEMPDEAQAKRAVEISLEELGLDGHQCVWALHQNTENCHVHISVNRIDPMTYKAIDAAGGYTQKAMERAARRVEYEQGWEVEKNAWTTYDGERVKDGNPREPRNEERIPTNASDMEHQTGEKSAIRIAKDRLKDRQFASWEELHRGLAERGMRYERKGSGAVIFVGDTPVKASSAGKRFALGCLEKKFGEFRPADEQTRASVSTAHISEPVGAAKDSPDWQGFIEERKRYYDDKRRDKDAMRQRIEREKKELQAKQQAERDAAFKGQSFKGRYQLLNSMRAAFGARHRLQRQEMKERHAAERRAFYDSHGQFPCFEDWLRSRGKEKEAEAWRHRSDRREVISASLTPTRETESAKEITDIRGFDCRPKNNELIFVNRQTGVRAFVDRGRKIDVLARDDEAALLASLQLAAQKWGTVSLNGNKAFKLRCLALAAEHGIEISNPELQTEYKERLAEHEKREAERTPARSLRGLADFRRYHEAVGADRYMVTATQIFDDGAKRGFMVNKRDGAPDGFTPFEMEKRMSRLISLDEREGRNVYYTPVSDDKHHILIDDLTSASLDKLIEDGYRPAAVIESSPNNWQAIITIPKLGTDRDREIGNEIVARLNKEYGDPKVSGEIHAHRAPGFRNRKPKHRDERGNYPTSALVRAEKVVCAKTSALAAEIRDELDARDKETRQQMKAAAKDLPPETSEATKRTALAYALHFRDIYQLQQVAGRDTGKTIDISRVDSMTCVRLRVTGHGKDAIRAAVEVLSPRMRAAAGQEASAHIWPDYALRTANFAFSYAGDRQAAAYGAKYGERWKKMEVDAAPKPTPAQKPKPVARPISERARMEQEARRRGRDDFGPDI